MNVAILGLGSRGELYADIIYQREKDCKIVAVCDLKAEKCRYAVEKYGVAKDEVFQDENEFFNAGKLADVLVVSTMDSDHYRHTISALRLGYDILLEKPISPKEEECREIIQTATELGRKIAVCHVLRYTPFYGEIKKRIQQGEIGNIMTISATENVGWWHQAHSFVRGNWRNSAESSPMILQKCCHDMDIIRWLVDAHCVSVSSFGALSHFKKENQPKGATARCVDCPHQDACLYSAKKYYIEHWKEIGMPQKWPFDVITTDRPYSEESLWKAIETSPWGRCVYDCDNNVVDHQICNMKFENGVIAQLNMVAFSEKNDRRIHIWGTQGEIIGDMDENWIEIIRFSKGVERIDLSKMDFDTFGHGGGDIVMVHDFLKACESDGTVLSSATASLESHLMSFGAEKSRLRNGEIVEIL